MKRFAAKAQRDCTGVPDGTVIEWGCRSYSVCENEQLVIIDCSETGQVYNPDIMACDEYICSHIYKLQRRVMFSEASVSHSVQGGCLPQVGSVSGGVGIQWWLGKPRGLHPGVSAQPPGSDI